MLGAHAKLVELQTRNEFKNNPIGDTGLVNKDGMENIINGLEADQEPTE